MLYRTLRCNPLHLSLRQLSGFTLVIGTLCGGIARAQAAPEARQELTARPAQDLRALQTLPVPTMSPVGSNLYAGYNPFACGQAVGRFGAFAAGDRRLTWRDRWPATAATRAADSVAEDSARQVANADVRRCLAKHSVSQTRTEHLIGLGTAWVSVDDEAQASMAFHTLLHRMEHAPVLERAFALQQIVSTYAGHGGARFDTALVFMRELDALGKEAAGYRLTARNTLYGVASAMDSVPLMVEHARIGLALQQTITGDTQLEWLEPSLVAIANQADLEARQANYKPAVARLTQAIKEFEPIDAMLTGAILGVTLGGIAPLGYEFPQVKATYAFAAGDSAPLSTPLVAPVKGRVSLVISGSFPFFVDQDYPLFHTILELQEKFGSSIDVVMLGQMTGTNGPKKATPAEEAPLFEEFYHTYLRMKLPIVVYNRAVTGKRDDGALFYEQNPNNFGMFVLVNKRGEFRTISRNVSRLRWIHLIEEALRE